MSVYDEMTTEERASELERLRAVHQAFADRGIKLDMTRGKPCTEQLDLSMPMLDELNADSLCTDGGVDCRNYGCLEGIPAARALMAAIMDDEPDNVIIYGASSLNAMYDTVARCMNFGCAGGVPWRELDVVRWICPSPGYDRHFAICEAFGIEMLPVAMGPDGPDMDEVERLVGADPAIKGMWCVPQYANPTGVTYSDAVVARLAEMETAAADFRIFWDNAYAVHHLYDEPERQDHVADIGELCRLAGHERRAFKFASTSKVTFPGAGVAAIASSPANVAEIKGHLGVQTIGADKLNQLRHALFLPDGAAVAAHMARHAAILRPKFELVERRLSEELGGLGIASWSQPRGGYFVSFEGPRGSARRIGELAASAGLAVTKAGATWPHGYDPADSNIRIAPTMPPLSDLGLAMDIFCTCVKIAALELASTPPDAR